MGCSSGAAANESRAAAVPEAASCACTRCMRGASVDDGGMTSWPPSSGSAEDWAAAPRDARNMAAVPPLRCAKRVAMRYVRRARR
eukprot:scaffold7243_cov66-Phaeocystis_antarctica.AAC.3